MCVLPNIGARFVSKDFDAAAEGFEEVTALEQPKMLLAAEAGIGAALEDMGGVEELERQFESPVFIQAVATGVANVLREALAKATEALSDREAYLEGSRSEHSEGTHYA